MKNLLTVITLVATLCVGEQVFAQPDFSTFVVAPYMQRANQAQQQGDWAEVRRQTEGALRRVPTHLQARLLLIEALLNLEEFARAGSQASLLPAQQQPLTQTAVRERWASEGSPELSTFTNWRTELPQADWMQLVQIHLAGLAQRQGQLAAFDWAMELRELYPDDELARLAAAQMPEDIEIARERELLLDMMTIDDLAPGRATRLAFIMASDNQPDQVNALLDQQPSPSWRLEFIEALSARLIFLERYERAKQVIQDAWPLETMPAPQREQLVELALLSNDATLLATPGLRDEQYCMDSVAWIGERASDLAGDMLLRCDQEQDSERWLYLASLYNPALLPAPVIVEAAPAVPEVSAAEIAQQLLAQRLQDALDASYQGVCTLSSDPELDVIRDEVRAICLKDSLPGVASVYFDLVLADQQNPRRQELLREAAYNAYQAGDYNQALSYWQQISGALNTDEQAAVTATRLAQNAASSPAQNPDTVTPIMTLAQLQAQAPTEPALYGLELGLRLSGSLDADVRAQSIPWLEAAQVRDPYDFRIPETLTYRYHELADPGLAVINAKRGIDRMDSALAVAGVSPEQLVEREFSLRRTHQYLTQRNRLYVGGAWSRFGVLDAIGATPRNSAFQIVSFEHLLGEYPDAGGRQLGVYGRALGSGTNNRRFFEDPAWGLGLRWKPIGTQNLNLFAEVFNPAQGDTDLLLRASASLLDAQDLREDWRPQDSRWHWQSLYLDAAWFAVAENYQLFASYSRGVEFKVSSSRPNTLSPYVSAWTGQSKDFNDTAAGLGLRYRHWLREDTYNAWKNRVDVRLELYRSIAGDRKNTNGWRVQTEWML